MEAEVARSPRVEDKKEQTEELIVKLRASRSRSSSSEMDMDQGEELVASPTMIDLGEFEAAKRRLADNQDTRFARSAWEKARRFGPDCVMDWEASNVFGWSVQTTRVVVDRPARDSNGEGREGHEIDNG